MNLEFILIIIFVIIVFLLIQMARVPGKNVDTKIPSEERKSTDKNLISKEDLEHKNRV